MNNNKRATEKIAARGRKEDAVLNRVLAWFGAAVVAECVLLLLNRYYINATTRPGELEFQGALFHAFPALTGIIAVAVLVCIVWFVLSKKAGKSGLLPGIFSAVSIGLLIISLVTYHFSATGVQFLCAAVPAAAVLALVYYLYQHEFFLISLLSAMGIVWLWAFRRGIAGHPTLVYAAAVLAAVILLLAVLLCRWVQKNGGVVSAGKNQFRVFSSNGGCRMVYVTCGIVAAAIVATLLFGLTAAYYLIFAVVAWIFVMAVYYTVKLM